MTHFFRFDLRTTDAPGARAFYSQVLGHDRASIWPLHEQALARGARPHWLGQLGVDDVEGVIAAMIEQGATRLGPVRPNREGGQGAVLRDPGGALVAIATPPLEEAERALAVGWHVLHTNDAERATANYRALFGWSPTARVEVAGHGPFQEFAWSAGGESVGAIGDVAGRPGVHPQWLFFFDVEELEPAADRVRAGGGVVVAPVVLAGGARLCVCDDPQGAAFGLREKRRA